MMIGTVTVYKDGGKFQVDEPAAWKLGGGALIEYLVQVRCGAPGFIAETKIRGTVFQAVSTESHDQAAGILAREAVAKNPKVAHVELHDAPSIGTPGADNYRRQYTLLVFTRKAVAA